MQKSYYRMMFLLYLAALITGGACQIWLKLNYIDVSTGFYLSTNAAVTAVYLSLLVIPGAMLMSLIKQTEHDYPAPAGHRAGALLPILAGISLVFFVMEQTGWTVLTPHSGTQLQDRYVLTCGILGGLAAMSFLFTGLYGLFQRDRTPGSLILLLPPVYHMVLIVGRFNSYTTLTTIPDNLLAVLFMVFSALFLLGNARTICGFSRRDGRNYLLPSGLATVLTGFLLCIPNFVYMAVCQSPNPAHALGDMESIYVLIISIHALVTVIRFRRSIVFV